MVAVSQQTQNCNSERSSYRRESAGSSYGRESADTLSPIAASPMASVSLGNRGFCMGRSVYNSEASNGVYNSEADYNYIGVSHVPTKNSQSALAASVHSPSHKRHASVRPSVKGTSLRSIGNSLARGGRKGGQDVNSEPLFKKHYHVILDMDIGTDVDDAISLILAFAPSEFSVCGVTVVGRQSLHRARIAQKIVESLGGSKDLVHAGLDTPLYGYQRFNWFGNEVKSAFLDEDDTVKMDAVDFLVEYFSSPPVQTDIVALGPMTNIAAALKKNPSIEPNIHRIWMMGGSARPCTMGNQELNPFCDYNLASDPEASLIVFDTEIKLALVPMNVTLQTGLMQSDVEQLSRLKSPLIQNLVKDIKKWSEIEATLFDAVLGPGARSELHVNHLHDPLVLAAMCEPKLLTFDATFVECSESENRELKKPVLRTVEPAEPGAWSRPVQLACEVDADLLRKFVIARLSRLDAKLNDSIATSV